MHFLRKNKFCTAIVLAAAVITSCMLGITSRAADNTVTISFAGDCTLGSYKGSSNKFATFWDPENPGYYFQNVRDIFSQDDITFVNLEGPLTKHEQTVEKTYPMRGEPEYVSILSEGSVEAVNLSNNHIFDCGQAGFSDTLACLENAGIRYAGEGYSATISKNGIKSAFLGYKGWQDTESLRKQIAEDIQTLRQEGADIVCVEFHWGTEREYYPDSTQKNLAHHTIDSGADVVVGAHPHVLQGVEQYKDKIIAYSLGNFCFGGNGNPADKDTMIFQTDIDKNGNIQAVRIVPCTTSSVDYTNDFCPTPQLGNEKNGAIAGRIMKYSEGLSDGGSLRIEYVK